MCDLRHSHPKITRGAAFISFLSAMSKTLDWIVLKPEYMQQRPKAIDSLDGSLKTVHRCFSSNFCGTIGDF